MAPEEEAETCGKRSEGFVIHLYTALGINQNTHTHTHIYPHTHTHTHTLVTQCRKTFTGNALEDIFISIYFF